MDAIEFRNEILAQAYRDLHAYQKDNYSYERFSYDGVDRSREFDVKKHLGFLLWFFKEYEGVFTAWTRLTDEASRDLYIDLVRFRLSGHLHVAIKTPVRALGAELQNCQAQLHGQPSTIALSGMFGQLIHYEGTWQGIKYEADTVPSGLALALVYGQYYFNRDTVRVQPELGDWVIDAGAFTGETAIVFSKHVGPQGRVYAFDPVKNHHDVCKLNFSRGGYENVALIPYGVGDRNVDAPAVYSEEYNPGYRVSTSETPVPLRTIDHLVESGVIPKYDFLKMDVEGSEMAALRGAEASIRRFRPKLAISTYHKPNDFFDIINYVYDLNLGYSLFLDHYTIYEEETVLYAVVLQ